MNSADSSFLKFLTTLDRGALSILRRSLSQKPGEFPGAYPFVEPFVGNEVHAQNSRRKAMYLVAGLYALHPHCGNQSFAQSFGEVLRDRSTGNELNKSIENRFIAVLESDEWSISDYIRHSMSLISSKGYSIDYGALLQDLSAWMNPNFDKSRIKQRWARDFYVQRFAKAANDDKAFSVDTEKKAA